MKKNRLVRIMAIAVVGILLVGLGLFSLDFYGVRLFGCSNSSFKPLIGDYWNPVGTHELKGISIASMQDQSGRMLSPPSGKVEAEEFLSTHSEAIDASLGVSQLVPIDIKQETKTLLPSPRFNETSLARDALNWLLYASISALQVGDKELANQYFEGQRNLYSDLQNRPLTQAHRMCVMYREQFFSVLARYLSAGNPGQREREIVRTWVSELLEPPTLNMHNYIQGAYSMDFSSRTNLKLLKWRFKEEYMRRKLPVPNFNEKLALDVASSQVRAYWNVESKYQDWSQDEMESLYDLVKQRSKSRGFYALPRTVMQNQIYDRVQPESIIESYFKVACIDAYLDYLDWQESGKSAGSWVPDFSRYAFGFRATFRWVRPNDSFGPAVGQDISRGGMLFHLVDRSGSEAWPASKSGCYTPFPIGTDVVKFFGK